MLCEQAMSCCGVNELFSFDSPVRGDRGWGLDYDDEDEYDDELKWKDVKTRAKAKALVEALVEPGLPTIAYTLDDAEKICDGYEQMDWKNINRVLKLAGFRKLKGWYNPNHGNHIIMWFRAPFKKPIK